MVLELILRKNDTHKFRSCLQFICLAAFVVIISLGSSTDALAAKRHKHHAAVAKTSLKDRYASIVVDTSNGKVLSQENSDKRLYPASLTKMMTLYLTFEALEEGRLHKSTYLEVSKRAANQPPSNIGFRHSDSIRVENAILALVTKSANDVAVVLAEAIGGTEKDFAVKMTKKARELGMRGTSFANASGLFNKNQYTTARDMAILGTALINDYPQYYHYFATPEFTYKGNTYKNHNKLMQSYRGMDGLKTGYIYASGFNLAASAKRDGTRLVGIVFGGRTSSTRNKMMAKILDAGFSASKNTFLAFNSVQEIPAKRPAAAPAKSVRELYTKTEEFEQGDTSFDDSDESSRKWAVQVGSFKTKKSSLKAIKQVKSSIDNLIEAKDVVAPLVTSRGTIYRARITGITLGDARSACNMLQGRCLILTAD